jgi:hypothetical protein
MSGDLASRGEKIKCSERENCSCVGKSVNAFDMCWLVPFPPEAAHILILHLGQHERASFSYTNVFEMLICSILLPEGG